MKSFSRLLCLVATVCLSAACALAQGGSPASPPPTQQQPQVAEWVDNFDGKQLDEDKWERFSFEGTSGGKLKVEEGELRMRGTTGSRSGVRSKQSFTGDRFIFEATITKVDMLLPAPDQKDTLGTAVLAVRSRANPDVEPVLFTATIVDLQPNAALVPDTAAP